MFSNYLKLAWRVLGRNKFFTFISLFGISFTLAILMIIVSFFQTQLGNNAPFQERDRIVMLNRVEMQSIQPDTLFNIDSLLTEGIMQYDTSFQISSEPVSTTISAANIHFLNTHFRNLENAQYGSFYVPNMSFNSFVNNTKVVLELIWTDEYFWDILEFDFLEGQPYDATMVENAAQVAVITDKLAVEYFGTIENVIGRYVSMDGKNHEVIGLIKKHHSGSFTADIFAPITLVPRYPGPIDQYTGGAYALFLAHTAEDVEKLKAEIAGKSSTIPMDIIPDYNTLALHGRTLLENYSMVISPRSQPEEAKRIFILVMIGVIGLFVLLPTLNLINLNISRIMERSSEIGVRKAFGANQSDILFQFVFENVLLTILGGIIGLIAAIVIIYTVNSGGLLDNVKLSMNVKFFVYAILTTLLFGILSGILPSLRMSKLNIVKALKENQL